ncbi:g-type lectin s-receptor-like serine/threonine-protein kinase [Quercus suber]|uniref:G-type lectin s-receptor-like serine/threonine-protein kinase n=1 Tax=Quercus suber TaxID=58331 RepID=A0AAW0M4E8_QUESU
MDLSGQIQPLYWLESIQQWNLLWAQPRTQCEGFEPRSSGNWELSDYTAGCARKPRLQCENNNQTTVKPDEFVMLSNVQLPVNPVSFESGSLEECKSTCLNSCSCTGYALNDYNCSIWIGDLINLQQLSANNHSARDFYVTVAASVLSPERNKRKLWIIVVLAISLTAISSAAFIWWMRKKTYIKLKHLYYFCCWGGGVLFLFIVVATTSAAFTCTINTTTTNSTCRSLVDYVPVVSAVQSLFQIKRFHNLLGANDFSTSTSPNQTLPAKQRIKIPFSCRCENGTGVSDKPPCVHGERRRHRAVQYRLQDFLKRSNVPGNH